MCNIINQEQNKTKDIIIEVTKKEANEHTETSDKKYEEINK